jgi:Uri superfamily endonuclease
MQFKIVGQNRYFLRSLKMHAHIRMLSAWLAWVWLWLARSYGYAATHYEVARTLALSEPITSQFGTGRDCKSHAVPHQPMRYSDY